MDDVQGGDEIITRDDGTRLHCASAGQGPPVVLAHGYLDDQNGFDEVVARLGGGRRVVRFDQRGHGRSTIGSDGISPHTMAGDYRAVLEHFDVNDGVLVGHSMGAFLSVVFSILHGDVAKSRLRRLVLVSGHAGDVARGSAQNRVQVALIKYGVMKMVMSTDMTARWMARSLFGDVAEPRFVTKAVDIFRRADQMGTLPILKAQVAESYYERLGEIPVPAIVICGDRDRTCPRFHSERLGAEIPGSRNVWLAGIGHMVTYEAPQAIVDAVVQ